MEFKCPKCQHTRLESVAEDATVTSSIINIDKDGDIEYGVPIINDASMSTVQCAGCGFILKYKNTHPILDEDIADWVEENCKQ